MTQKFDYSALQAAQNNQTTSDFKEYTKLLREIATGKCRKTPDETLAILNAVDRNATMLKEDVEKRTERDRKIAELGREKEYTKERDALTKELKELSDEFAEIEAQYEEKEYVLNTKRDSFERKLRAINTYHKTLVEECDDLNLIFERERLQKVLKDSNDEFLYQQKSLIPEEIRHLERTLDTLPITIDYHENKRAIRSKIKELYAKCDEIKQLEIEQEKLKQKNEAALLAHEEKMRRS